MSRPRRPLVLAVLASAAGGLAGAALAVPAHAADGLTGTVANRTATITATPGIDRLRLALDPSFQTLHADLGIDGTIDFSAPVDDFDRLVVDGGAANDLIQFAVPGASGALSMTQVELRGGDGDDHIAAGGGGELVTGGPGDDFLIGGDGDDALLGDAGNDRLAGGDGRDAVHGGDGDDGFDADSEDSDDLDGGPGLDDVRITTTGVGDLTEVRASALPGRVVVNDDAGHRQELTDAERLGVFTGGGDDRVIARRGLGGRIELRTFLSVGDDVFTGGDGADTVDAGPGDDAVFGGAGDDAILGGTGRDEMLAGDGADRLRWRTGDGGDIVSGGTGADELSVEGTPAADSVSLADDTAGPTRVKLTAGVDNLIVETLETVALALADGDDVVRARYETRAALRADLGAGNDDIEASELGDTLITGDGDDRAMGRGGADTIDTGAGGDIIRGMGQDDVIAAGPGDDLALWTADDGNDRLDGGDGADRFDWAGSDATEKVSLLPTKAPGHTRIVRDVGGLANDLVGVEGLSMRLFDGNDELAGALTLPGIATTTIFAGAGDDRVQTGPAADTLAGQTGNDILRAGAGNDDVKGEDGDDLLAGEAGADRLDGGTGIDTFSCAGRGDTLVSAPEDVVGADCL